LHRNQAIAIKRGHHYSLAINFAHHLDGVGHWCSTHGTICTSCYGVNYPLKERCFGHWTSCVVNDDDGGIEWDFIKTSANRRGASLATRHDHVSVNISWKFSWVHVVWNDEHDSTGHSARSSDGPSSNRLPAKF
jgi:hypothetical protein